MVVIAAIAMVVLLASAALAWQWPSHSSSGGKGGDAGADAPRPSASSDQPPRPTSRAPIPDPSRLAAALQPALSDPGFAAPAQLEVADLDTEQVLYARSADAPGVPASTAKLLTATVALHELGPTFRLQTKAYLAGRTLYLVGGGDPTLASGNEGSVHLAHGTLAHPASLADLARQVRRAGVTKVDRVVGDASLFTGPPLAAGWPPYYVNSEIAPVSALQVAERRTSTPSQTATSAMQSALTSAGVSTGGAGLGRVPPAARLVGTVSSPPLSDLVEHMLTWSDNDLAEALGRVLAAHDGRPADFVGEAAAVVDGAGALGLPVQDVQMHDASGLSQQDRVSPALLVDVLEMATDPAHPELSSIPPGLPVAAHTGTLLFRYHAALTKAGAGVVHAKSGRVLGTNALAGLVRTRQGRLLVFSLRGLTTSQSAGEQAVDRVAATLAGCGCR